MTVERTRPKTLLRRFERRIVSVVMGMMAFVLEKVVLRAVKKGEAEPPKEHPAEPKPTTMKSQGGEVDL